MGHLGSPPGRHQVRRLAQPGLRGLDHANGRRGCCVSSSSSAFANSWPPCTRRRWPMDSSFKQGLPRPGPCLNAYHTPLSIVHLPQHIPVTATHIPQVYGRKDQAEIAPTHDGPITRSSRNDLSSRGQKIISTSSKLKAIEKCFQFQRRLIPQHMWLFGVERNAPAGFQVLRLPALIAGLGQENIHLLDPRLGLLQGKEVERGGVL